MRHIPEDELHAYLDQALSRSQCVEIECHLAGCIRCRHVRDQIAALRDRTTALLGDLVPPLSRRPAFAALMLRANTRRMEQDGIPSSRASAGTTWTRRGAQAAGVALLIAVGWSARGLAPVAPGSNSPAASQLASNDAPNRFSFGSPLLSSVLPLSTTPASQAARPAASTQPDPGWEPDPIERAAPRRVASVESPGVTPMALTVSSLDATSYSAEFPAPGVWRTVSWTEAAALTGDVVPRIHGMPVVEIQVQLLGPDERPLVMVAHQDPSGRIIRSIEGPADRLSGILSDVIAKTDGAVHTSQPIRTPVDYVSATTGGTRRSIRVAAIAGYLEASALDELTKSLTIR